jgi:cysteinyl-tRNA synthetase
VVVFDVLYRLLRHVYGAQAVTYVRNFTDVDDKINARAREIQARDGGDLNAIIRILTDETIGWYHADMDALGALRPTHEPRATEFIVQMVAMIEGLIAKGHAYAAEGHVLFDVRSYPDYGRLSGRSLDDMIAGARVEVAPYKRDPMDFVLWKPSADDEPGWDSPWGRGRPGWHIECSAMSHELLGPAFDIHGGGIDLQFPHHENEIAQSCCAHPDAGFANVWLHNEMVQVEGKKMSKSLGNFFTVRDLLEQRVTGEVIRFVFLMTHYRSPMDWTIEKVREVKVHFRGWEFLKRNSLTKDGEAKLKEVAIDSEIVAALSDDLNTSLAIRRLFHLSGRAKASSGVDSEAVLQFFAALSFLGIDNTDSERLLRDTSADTGYYSFELDTLARRLLELSKAAKVEKDFSKVDAFKDTLISAGIEVRMSKAGVELVPTPNFDPSKLDALK